MLIHQGLVHQCLGYQLTRNIILQVTVLRNSRQCFARGGGIADAAEVFAFLGILFFFSTEDSLTYDSREKMRRHKEKLILIEMCFDALVAGSQYYGCWLTVIYSPSNTCGFPLLRKGPVVDFMRPKVANILTFSCMCLTKFMKFIQDHYNEM